MALFQNKVLLHGGSRPLKEAFVDKVNGQIITMGDCVG